MSMTDPIADMLTRIRNAVSSRHSSCEIPASSVKENILKILKARGFIRNYVSQEDGVQKNLVVFLKYLGRKQQPVIKVLKRVSKPGRRLYSGYRTLKPVLGGLGVAVVSTPKGVMADKDARQNKLGGEVLCEVW